MKHMPLKESVGAKVHLYQPPHQRRVSDALRGFTIL